MDDAIGYVLDYIEKSGLDKNTLIIFTSDNGGVTSGDHYSTSLLPLRGGKGRQWEGGIREPLLIQYPGARNLAANVMFLLLVLIFTYHTQFAMSENEW